VVQILQPVLRSHVPVLGSFAGQHARQGYHDREQVGRSGRRVREGWMEGQVDGRERVGVGVRGESLILIGILLELCKLKRSRKLIRSSALYAFTRTGRLPRPPPVNLHLRPPLPFQIPLPLPLSTIHPSPRSLPLFHFYLSTESTS
jgi:hypothetical protein